MVEDFSFNFCVNRWKIGQVNGLAYLIRKLCDFDECDRVSVDMHWRLSVWERDSLRGLKLNGS